MKKILEENGVQVRQQIQRTQTLYQKEKNWPDPDYDFEMDCQKYADLQTKVTPENLKELVKPDPAGSFGVQFQVVFDEKIQKPYDILMTKVDIKTGPYGINLFYRMQLLIDTNRDVFVIFTRWGRVGETGAFQRTPFKELKDGETEFKKIFKAKSGNDWDQMHKLNQETNVYQANFEKRPGKYRLNPFVYKSKKTSKLIQPFKYDISSKLSPEIQDFMKSITEGKIFQTAMHQEGIDTNILSIEKLTKETVIECRQALQSLAALIPQLQELSQLDEEEQDQQKLLELNEKICDESSKFYELIPHTEYAFQAIPPINNEKQLQQKMNMLEVLEKIEQARKVLLGGLLNMNNVNPLDYCFNCLNIKLECVQKNEDEYKLILQYIKKSAQYSDKIKNIFRIQRKGELERIKQWEHLENHWLLWHGTKTFNLMGILLEGLKIAPPEAPISGWMFGKGIYLADKFQKSLNYTSRTGNHFLFLCEAALGQMYQVTEAQYMEKPPQGYNSTFYNSKENPNMRQAITLPNGLVIPCGDLEKNMSTHGYYGSNEYILYDVSQCRIRYIIHCDDTKEG